MKRILAILLVTILMGIALLGCAESTRTTEERDREVQEAILSKGQKAVPAYQTQNFLARKAINEYMRRMDTPDKLWYIYLMADSGAYIGYHISRTYPISIAVAMTTPVRIIDDPHGSYDAGGIPIPAPGIDGVFYNGIDPTLYYCFDAETDAMIMFTSEFIAYDKPLDIDIPLLRIKVE